MPTNTVLDNISIILVECRTPANIGSTARCMMNTGISRLILVRPPADRNDDAVRLAAGADAILRNSLSTATLAEALVGHNIVVGASRHAGRLGRNTMTPRDMACEVVPLLANSKVAVVFGNEINGLENSDLALCNSLVAIPSADAFPSLNLSHAVMVLAYELYREAAAGGPAADVILAKSEDLENFYRHLQETLEKTGFIEHDLPDRMMFSLRQIFSRAKLDPREVRILQGILSSIDRLERK